MKKLDLNSGHLGSGITVWNRAVQVGGDYKTVAHIGADRKITYYGKRISDQLKNYCEEIMNGPNPSISTSQPEMKVFYE